MDAFTAIPHLPLGAVPEELCANPKVYRPIVAKRALLASYEDAGIDSITDILTDLRHLCDAIDISFAEADHTAHQHYLTELKP